MTYTIDVLDDGRVLEWETTDDGAVATERESYTPRFYVGPRTSNLEVDLEAIRQLYDEHPAVTSTAVCERRAGFRRGDESVLAVDATRVDRVRDLARLARSHSAYEVGDLACFDVDFTREFRYCLETGTDPTPDGDLSTLRVGVPVPETATDTYGELSIDGETVEGAPRTILEAVDDAVRERDPDVLVLSTSEIVPTLYRMADAVGFEAFSLSRLPNREYQRLAGKSTFESYGRVGHSPARYNVFGRAIVDESNSFFYHETNLEGVLDLVKRSWKPLQETAWASIGNVLTAIQVREARERGVLVPWRSWRHEFTKPMGTLHDADRGGFTFAPEVGVHEDVFELDFSSLYPNIICEYNVSPETTRCDCHADRADVPELGYSICDEQGYLVDVLKPIVDDRDKIKSQLRQERARDDPDEDRLERLRGRSAALKWILVSCFGYQGFSNAKFGRIECHEAINAYAREIMLTAKRHLEDGGWRVVHGIVDSIWVTPAPDVPVDELEALETVADAITAEVGIRLEYEAAYDWVAFVPQRESQAGALTKYFGSVAGEDEFTVRGIEARQRSTPAFVTDVQRECLERFDETRSPEAAVTVLARALERLRRGDVDPQRLVERKRVSKPLEGYSQYTHNVAALERAHGDGIDVEPGQSVEYVVVDDSKSNRDRVALAHESPAAYDADYYERLLVRAVESVLSPLGWDRSDVRRAISATEDATLSAFR